MICLQTHTHTQIHIFLHTSRHTVACVSAPDVVHASSRFSSLSILSLIWFPLGKTSLGWWDLICHSYFPLFFPLPIVWLTYQLMAWLGADKPANVADRLKNCLAEWWVTAAEWMIGGHYITGYVMLTKSFFYLLHQEKLLTVIMPLIELWSHQRSSFMPLPCVTGFLLPSNVSYWSVLCRIVQLLWPMWRIEY